MRADENTVALWVGCYTGDMGGRGDGIVALRRMAAGAYEQLEAVTELASPSFLALHPSQPVLYAVSEGAERVHALRHDGQGVLSALCEPASTGSLVCHVAVSPDAAFLVVCCWGDGQVLLFELERDGSLGRRHVAPASADPSGELRQSRAHSCLMLGAGRMVTADMGHDLVRFWSFDADRGLEPRGAVRLPHGSGPRHFAQSSAGVVYVNTEYSGEVAMLTPRESTTARPWLELRGMFPVSAGGVQPGDATAEICLDPSERWLYVGVRGSDRICVLSLDGAGQPSPYAEFPCTGAWPRHHCLDDGRLLVALERSDAVASFPLDASGRPTGAPTLLRTGSPTCLLPAR